MKGANLVNQFKNNFNKSIKNANNTKKDKKDDEKIKKITKIQSIWKGIFIHKLMTYYWNINKYKDFIRSIIINHNDKKIYNDIKLFNNIKNSLLKLNIYNSKNNNPKKINIYKKNEFEELYKKLNKLDNLLKDYNNNLKLMN